MHAQSEDVVTSLLTDLKAGDNVTVSVERGGDIVTSWDIVMDEDGVLTMTEELEEE